MTTPQSTQEKAAYVAQYWGQPVISDVDNSGNKQLYPVEQSNMYRIEESHLELKPLSAISDEDAIEVAKLMYPKDRHDDKNCLQWGNEIAVEILQGQTDKDVIWFAGIIPVIDFLRSKSYALPWRQYSVEQLIEMGWLKLIENGK